MGGKPGGTLWDKMNWAAGVEYGYSLPVARRLNIDFTIGVGYWGGTYHEYKPVDDCYVWQYQATPLVRADKGRGIARVAHRTG